ncbi:MAG: hypothetical protein JOZ42_06675 [Acetobacteraceae bacterium]|nr:hypothetical protein [Acetobacteraceae bacterium]
MKVFLACLCLLLAGYSAWITARWWPGPPAFTDLLGQKASPDGSIVASYVVQNHGPMSGTLFGLTLSGRKDDPLKADPILTDGEDDSPAQFEWINDTRLEVRLPCGWWGHLTNHFQLKGTNRIVDIAYLPPPTHCPQKSSVPGAESVHSGS